MWQVAVLWCYTAGVITVKVSVGEKYGLWFLTVSGDRTALMNVRSWTLFPRFKLCKIITFQSARYGYLVLLFRACVDLCNVDTHCGGKRG